MTPNKWPNGVYHSPILDGVDGITEGCGKYTSDGTWTCTDHIQFAGRELHIAGSSDRICDVWFYEDGVELEVRLRGRGTPPGPRIGIYSTWDEAREALEKDERFFSPPTDEEVEAAREALAKLLERMES